MFSSMSASVKRARARICRWNFRRTKGFIVLMSRSMPNVSLPAAFRRGFLSPNEQRQTEHKSTDEADGISSHICGLIGELMPFCQHKHGQCS